MSEGRRRWFHLIATTYGAWLPGDPRGFRTQGHRDHVEGDYKNPPPKGKYDARHRRSRKLQKYPTMTLTPAQRAVVGTALRERLEGLGALVLVVSVGGQHAHILAKLPASTTKVISSTDRWALSRRR